MLDNKRLKHEASVAYEEDYVHPSSTEEEDP